MVDDRDSEEEPSEPRFDTGRLLLVAVLVLAVVCTGVLVFTDSAKWLRLGVLGGLWATMLGVFLATRYRKQVMERENEAADLQSVYQLELEREVAARREYELEIEAETRRKLQDESREDLAALRAELYSLRETLERLTGGEVLVERFALRAQSTRMRSLGEGQPRVVTAGPAVPDARRSIAAPRPPADNNTRQVLAGDTINAGTELIEVPTESTPRPAVRPPRPADTGQPAVTRSGGPQRPEPAHNGASPARPEPGRHEPAAEGRDPRHPETQRVDVQRVDPPRTGSAQRMAPQHIDPQRMDPPSVRSGHREPVRPVAGTARHPLRPAGPPTRTDRPEPGAERNRHRVEEPPRPLRAVPSEPESGGHHAAGGGGHRRAEDRSGRQQHHAARGIESGRHAPVEWEPEPREIEPEIESDAGAHAAGRSVTELLAAHGGSGTGTPRRRRRAD